MREKEARSFFRFATAHAPFGPKIDNRMRVNSSTDRKVRHHPAADCSKKSRTDPVNVEQCGKIPDWGIEVSFSIVIASSRYSFGLTISVHLAVTELAGIFVMMQWSLACGRGVWFGLALIPISFAVRRPERRLLRASCHLLSFGTFRLRQRIIIHFTPVHSASAELNDRHSHHPIS